MERQLSASRFLYYVAAAALLHACLIGLEYFGHVSTQVQVLERPWLLHALFVVAMLLVYWRPRQGLSLTAACAGVACMGMVPPLWFAALLFFVVVTWLVARTSLPTLVRMALVLGVYATVPCLRAGLAGQAASRLFQTTTAGEAVIWCSLLLRSLLYQVEAARLAPERRTLAGYGGSFALPLLTGNINAAPIPYERFLGRYGAAEYERNMRRGLGLIALGLLLEAGHVCWDNLVALPAWPLLVHPHLTAPALSVHERVLAGAALLSLWPALYLRVAGVLFVAIGSLRLLGFDLASGFAKPFLSHSFIDFWRRWNYYEREASVTLFYWPALARLRRRLSPVLAQSLAVGAALSGFFVVSVVFVLPVHFLHAHTLINNPAHLALAGRTLLQIVVTVSSAYRLLRRGPASGPVSTLARVRAIAVVWAYFIVGSALLFLFGSGSSWRDIVDLIGRLLGVV